MLLALLLQVVAIAKAGTIVVPAGSTNAQIQALANKLSAVNNVLYFNAGTYTITTPVKLPCNFPNGIKVVGPDTSPATAIIRGPKGSEVLSYSNCTQIEISRIAIVPQ